MPRPTYLIQRSAGFAFRLTVPADLRPYVGLREVVRSVQAPTRRQALATCRRAGLKGTLAFDMLRRMTMTKMKATALTPLDLKEYRRWLLEQIEQELDGIDRKVVTLSASQREGVDALTDVELDAVQRALEPPPRPLPEGDRLAREVLGKHGLSLDSLTVPDSFLARIEALDAWGELRSMYAEAAVSEDRSYPVRARILASRRQMIGAPISASDGGAFSPEALRQMHGFDVEEGKLPLSELFKRHREAHKETWKDWPKRVSSEFLPLERMVLEAVGDLPMERLNAGHVGVFADWIKREAPKRRWSEGTVGHWLNRFRTVLRWAHQRNMILDLTAPLRFKAKQNHYKAYTQEELRVLFESDDYRLMRFQRASEFWLPLLGYFTGARLDELESAEVSQFMEQDGIQYVLLSPGGAETGKNALSRREVPLHLALLEAGLEDYLAVLRAPGPHRAAIASRPTLNFRCHKKTA
jgi:hypothetical protein